MNLKLENGQWEPCINWGREMTIDIDLDIPGVHTVELTREDLESMLSALDNLENNQ